MVRTSHVCVDETEYDVWQSREKKGDVTDSKVLSFKNYQE
jgi:hypothetical protein